MTDANTKKAALWELHEARESLRSLCGKLAGYSTAARALGTDLDTYSKTADRRVDLMIGGNSVGRRELSNQLASGLPSLDDARTAVAELNVAEKRVVDAYLKAKSLGIDP